MLKAAQLKSGVIRRGNKLECDSCSSFGSDDQADHTIKDFIDLDMAIEFALPVKFTIGMREKEANYQNRDKHRQEGEELNI